MATQVRLRRGTTTEHASYTGPAGEVTVNTTQDRLVVHDGSTAGGHPAATKAEVDALDLDITAVENDVSGKADLAGSASQAFSASTVNATTVDLGDWTITQSGSDLKFAYNGTNRFSLSSSGALTVEDNVTAYGSA